jgi:hypothetical protein
LTQLQTAFAATSTAATAGLFAQMFNDRMGKDMTAETATFTAPDIAKDTAPKPETEIANASGGIDYSKEKEITQDEMTDELFAAVKRGDLNMVQGLTQNGKKNTGVKRANGVTLLIAAAQDRKDDIARELMTYKGVDLGAMTDAGVTAAMLFQTNGNVELARMLIAKLSTNTLLAMDGVNGDEMARSMGAHGLSETIKQAQRDEVAVKEEAEHQELEHGSKSNSLSATIRGWFGGDEKEIIALPMAEMEKPAAAVSADAEPTTFTSKFTKYITGISSRFFGPKEPEAMSLSAKPDLQPSPLTTQGAVQNFLKRLGPSI